MSAQVWDLAGQPSGQVRFAVTDIISIGPYYGEGVRVTLKQGGTWVVSMRHREQIERATGMRI